MATEYQEDKTHNNIQARKGTQKRLTRKNEWVNLFCFKDRENPFLVRFSESVFVLFDSTGHRPCKTKKSSYLK